MKQEIKEINAYNTGKPNPFIQIVSVLLAIASGPVLIYYGLRTLVHSDALGVVLLPLCFCRECGAEYYSVWKMNNTTGKGYFTPRDMTFQGDEPDDGEAGFGHSAAAVV